MSTTVIVHTDLPDGRTVEAGVLDVETNPGGALVSTPALNVLGCSTEWRSPCW